MIASVGYLIESRVVRAAAFKEQSMPPKPVLHAQVALHVTFNIVQPSRIPPDGSE